MKLVFRYVFYAAVALLGFVAFGVSRYEGARFIVWVPDILLAGAGAVLLLAAVSVWKEEQLTEQAKGVLMRLLLLAILLPTIFTIGAFAHQSLTSWSSGEVHFHADYEVIVQDEAGYHQLDLINPDRFCEETGHESTYMCRLNDRTGAVEYHEHNDRRIHLEGVFKHREDATLSAFFATFGGELTNTRVVYPTNDKVWQLENTGDRTLKIVLQRGVGGDRDWCAIGPDVPTDQVCIDAYTSKPARSPTDYVISPYQTGPPIDDIWLIYDDASVEEVLTDLRADNAYKQFEQEKTGEGY